MANRIWAEVYAPDGAGLGQATLASASITRMLDGAGDIQLTAPISERSISLLHYGRRVEIYWEHPAKGQTWVGSGILLSKNISAPSSLSWSGQDSLEDLRRASTLRGREYIDQPIADVIDDLVGLVLEDWSAKVDGGLGNTSRRFDGQSVLAALLAVVEGAGVHLRLKGQGLEVGAFGQTSGVRITNLRTAAPEAAHNDRLVIISTLTLVEEGHDIYNWIEPVWGTGDTALTLRRSTRTQPYPIQTMTGPDGKTIYYLEDAASVAQYGRIQRHPTMPDAPYIADGKMVNAANVLYDWAVAELQRKKEPQTTYQVSGVKLDRRVLPGDTVRLAYQGEITGQDGRLVRYADIDDDFYVLSLVETYGTNGQFVTWQISNLDRPAVDAVQLLTDALKQVEMQSKQQRLTSTIARYETSGAITPSTPVTLSFVIPAMAVDIGDATLSIIQDVSASPNIVTVTVDGVELAQTWQTLGGEHTLSVEISTYLYNADGTVAGAHTVQVAMFQHGGSVEIAVEVVEIGVSG